MLVGETKRLSCGAPAVKKKALRKRGGMVLTRTLSLSVKENFKFGFVLSRYMKLITRQNRAAKSLVTP